MNAALIPRPDTIPVAWGWFQFLLLLTFPLHLLAMNAMVGGLLIGVSQHFQGRPVNLRLAHRLAVLLPLAIAFAVNFGVAPLLFSQVLYGHLFYTSSILMASFWLAVIPILITAYYGAYLYDFRFDDLGVGGRWLGLAVLLMLFVIGYLFSNNMHLMLLTERFAGYFDRMDGSMLASTDPVLLPRYLHMMLGAVAVGGLFVALAGRFWADRDQDMASLAEATGLKTFFWATLANIAIGSWFLVSLPRQTMLLFMGGDIGASVCFVLSLLLTVGMLVTAWKRKFWLTFWHAVATVVLMSFMRAWMRSDYLREVFNLGQLEVVPEYSPMIFFFVVLVAGLVLIGWMLRKTAEAFARS
ncbi:MAG: hypothetical protein F9K32_16315 [Desulfobulbaceae bacterium]|nr:MAG: hypothetical protein F9K32_16315 [Desulfobulbaceae bacterium]